MRQIPSSVLSSSLAPVGLLGLQSRIARVRRHERFQLVEIGRPPRARGLRVRAGWRVLSHGPQPPWPDGGAQAARQARCLHVVRREEHDFVAGLDEAHQQHAVGLGPAVGDLDMVRRRARIHGGDGFPQLGGAVGLRIPQFLLQEGVVQRRRIDQLGDPQRLDAAFRDVPRHAVFPDRLEPLERERFKPHCRKV